jgi:tubulin monoglycylase TTLL3/8
MNGKENIWIVKPSGLSRGRGIQLFNSYAEIMHHVNTRDFSWVIQKYMENPLLYKGKKLDIRQWVLVTNWNPLTIWFYQECYIRVSTAAYTLKNIKDR